MNMTMTNMNKAEKSDKKKSDERWDFWRYLFRGKIYLINPHFQYRFMAWVLAWATFSLVVFFLSNYFFFDQMISKGKEMGLSANHAYFMLINDQKVHMAKIYLIASSIITVSITFWGLFFSHRIAGPMFRLHRTFAEATREGCDIDSPIKFRETDFFAEVPESINEYLSAANEKKGEKVKDAS